jgi:hypothetical protein
MKQRIGEKRFYGGGNVPAYRELALVTYANPNCPINCRSSTVRELEDARENDGYALNRWV